MELTEFRGQYSLEELSLAERKLALLVLLKKIDAILAENGLGYTGYYGTLLGCIRHSGFIPWDDDIDLAMPRETYDKLKLINWKDHGLDMQSPQVSDNSPFTFAKISDPSFVFVEPIQNGDSASGLNIDIFPLDAVSSSMFEFRDSLVRFLCRLLVFKVVKDDPSRPFYKRVLLRLGRMALWHVPVGRLTRLIDTLSSRLEATSHSWTGCIAGPYRQREIMHIDWFTNLTSLKFEDFEIPIPSEYDRILEKLYGEYMELPPEHKRASHHSSAVYRKVLLNRL